MNSLNSHKPFVVKYVLPSGKVVGYHLNTGCQIGEKGQAKIYTSDPKSVLNNIHNSFTWVWEHSEEEYRTQRAWEGATLGEIKIVPEEI